MKITMKDKVFVYITIGLFLMMNISCNRNVVYSEYQSIEKNEWNMDSVLSFNVDIQDTVSSFNILVNVRNAPSYKYQNLWLFIDSYSPDSILLKDTIECYLANNKGEWLGSGLGSTYSMPVLYMNNIRFPKKGIYHFDITQGMRDVNIQGITDIGIEVEKVN